MTSLNYEENDWIIVKEFQLDSALIQITRLWGHRPKYSYRICRSNEDGTLIPFFGVFVEYTKGIINNSVKNHINTLIEKAEEWILQEVAKREEEIRKKQIENKEINIDITT